MTMLDVLKGRLPRGLEIVKAKLSGGYYKLLFRYEGAERPGDLPTTCVPGKEKRLCDVILATAMTGFFAERGDVEAAVHWFRKTQTLLSR